MSSLAPALFVLMMLAAPVAGSGDDLELAAALARRGWFDLADEICERVRAKTGLDAETRAALALARAEISVEKSRRDADPWKAAKELDGAAEVLLEAAAGDVASAEVRRARSERGGILLRKARRLADAAETEDAGSAGMLRAEAIKAYAAAEQVFRGFSEDLDKLPSSPDVERDRMVARLALPKAMSAGARLLGPSEAARKKLQEAVELLGGYQLDYSPRPISVDALLEEARCRVDLGDTARAESRLREVVKLANSGVRPEDFRLELIHGATMSLARSLTRRGKAKDAIDLLDRAQRENRAFSAPEFALPLQLERAKSLQAFKDDAAALREAQAVLTADPDGPFGAGARQLICAWAKEGISAAKALMLVADAFIARGRFRDALGYLRRSVEGCKDAAERAALEPVAAFKRGECLQGLRRRLEAVEAYKDVFSRYPKHELAPRAGFEAIQCLSHESSLTGDLRWEEEMMRLLPEVEKLGLAGTMVDFLQYLKAETLERRGALREAAELYSRVRDSCDLYERALVAAGHCRRRDVVSRWEKSKRDPAIREELARQMAGAEESLRTVVERFEKSEPPADPMAARTRERLRGVALQELSTVLLHELVGKTKEGLAVLDRSAAFAVQQGESLARIWEREVLAHLTNGDLDAATSVLAKLLAKYPDGAPTARSLGAVAARLDRRATEMIEKKGDPKAIIQTLRTAGRYTKQWIDLAPRAGLTLGLPELADGADRLYRVARGVNGLDAAAVSAFDLKGKRIADGLAFEDAASTLTLLDARAEELTEKDRTMIRLRLARCLGFIATDLKGWGKAQMKYDQLIAEAGLLGANGRIDLAASQAHPELLSVYVEQGGAFLEMARKGPKFQYDNVIAVNSNLLRVLAPLSEAWWNAKFAVATALFERGGPGDLKLARVMLENLELNYGIEYDGGKHGMREKFVDLREKIRKVGGR